MDEPNNFWDDRIIAELYFHVIFWTRKAQPAMSAEMLAKACEELDQAMFAVEGEALAAGGGEEHLHIIVRASPNFAVQQTLDTLRDCCIALLAQTKAPPGVSLNDDPVCVTISPSQLPEAKRFANDQASHHQTVTFQSELLDILNEHKIEYDPRELWE